MSDFLEKILKDKRQRLPDQRVFLASFKKGLNKQNSNRYSVFKKSISRTGNLNLIAEIKKASPSYGVIRDDFDVVQIAKIYTQNQADALSVLTEEKYFLGNPQYVRKVQQAVPLPILVKDFIIDEIQIFLAIYNGASAVLLIVNILTDAQLRRLMTLAHSFDLDCLVEVHNKEELGRAIDQGAEIIGINHRDLHTFKVDLKVSERLIPLIPKHKVIVVESGIKSHEEIKRLKQLGAHAVLIGETFMRAPDIGAKVREIMYGQG